MKAEGVTVRPIAQLDGETGFAEVFLEGVRVPAANVVGERDRGWAVAMATAGFERGLSLRSPARYSATGGRLVELYSRLGRIAGPGLRDGVVPGWMGPEAYRLQPHWSV